MLENISYLIAILGSICGATFFISKKLVCSERASDKALETCEELEKMQKESAKIDNPYGKNYKKDLEDLKQKNSEKNSLIKDKIHNLINHFQSLNK